MKNFFQIGYPSKNFQNHSNPYARKIFMTVFEFTGHFFIQNDVFKLQEVFLELGIGLFLESGL
jgi:hypothetical protein